MKIYGLYKGEKFIATGTVNELAKLKNVKPATILFYGYQSYAKRTRDCNSLRLVRL